MTANFSHPANSPIHRTTRPSARPAYGPRPWLSNSIDSGPNTSPTNSSLPCLRRLALSLGQLPITSLYGVSSCFTGRKSMPASELSRNGSAITRANANAAKKRLGYCTLPSRPRRSWSFFSSMDRDEAAEFQFARRGEKSGGGGDLNGFDPNVYACIELHVSCVSKMDCLGVGVLWFRIAKESSTLELHAFVAWTGSKDERFNKDG
jgi:hypothetical protein